MWTVIATTLKAVLAVALVGGAATAVVAPALEMAGGRGAALNQPTPTHTPDPDGATQLDFETLLLACLDSMDPDSTACGFAHAKSGMSRDDFRQKIVAKMFPELLPTPAPTAGPAEEPTAAPTKTPLPVVAKTAKPQTGPAVDFWTYFEKCLATADINTDVCHTAYTLSGMSRADFEAKFKAKLAALQQSQFWTYFEKCLATRDLRSDVCQTAYTLSGMSLADFEAKFKAKLAAKDGADFWTWFDKCLATGDEHSAECEKAQSLIGMNDADFHAKFERYLAARSASPKPTASATPKPSASATPKPSATSSTLNLLVQECGESRSRSSDACIKALALSGLSPEEFWARVEFTYGHFD